MKQRYQWALFLDWLFAQLSALHAAERQPNVVVILADDAGWGDLSCNGNPHLSTPHLDSLAKDGARFERFYVCPCVLPRAPSFSQVGIIHAVACGMFLLEASA